MKFQFQLSERARGGGGGREREGARMNFHPKSMRRTGD